MIERPRWMRRGNCVGVAGTVFFPDLVGISDKVAFREARALCETCEVQKECLEQAMRNELEQPRRFGMWGGLTPKERRGLQSERDAQAARELQRIRVQPARQGQGTLQSSLLEALPDPELGAFEGSC
jgi:hypothetical protein